MIPFHPNGSVQTKVNMYSHDDWLKGNFIDCLLEPGNVLSCGHLGVDESDSCIALFSLSSSFELFYLCKVLEFGTATEDMIDSYNHQITIDTKYILCNYLKKIAEK